MSGFAGQEEDAIKPDAVTNHNCSDLAWGRPADEVLTALEEIWSIPLSKRGKVLALTVPEIKMEDARLDERRNAVNSGIKSYRKQNL